MSFHVRWEPRLLHFRQPAGTSRGVYRIRQIWLLHLTCDTLPGREGIGECAPLPDLSIEWDHFFEKKLYRAGSFIEEKGPQAISLLKELPSVLFAFETALRHLSVGDFALWNTPFSCNQEGISINGLVWMGTEEQMLSQIEHKLSVGYRCIKLKIGAIDFEKELGLLSFIRRQYSPEEVEIRVDANGAFFPQEAPEKLFRLAALGLHSIEQPIAPGQWEAMARLCQISPLPIALDEELIGIHTSQRKREMLQKNSSSVHRSQTLFARRLERLPRMDKHCRGVGHRMVGDLRFGIEYRAQRNCPVVCYFASYYSSRIGYGTVIYR